MKNFPTGLILCGITAGVFLAGCAPKGPPPELPKVFTEKEAPARPGAVPMKPTNPSPASSPGKGSPAAVRGYTPKDDPLFAVPGEPLTAFDFSLGALQGLFVSGEERAVQVLLSSFFQNLREGKAIMNLLHPDYRSFLSRDLALLEGKKIDIDSVRYGEFAVPLRGEPMVETPVVVLGKKGRAEGRILVEKMDGTWYISLLLLDLEELELPLVRDPNFIFTPQRQGSVF